MTVEIELLMKDMEATWDRLTAATLFARDLDAALATLSDTASVTHLPLMTGGTGHGGLERFYRDEVFDHVPADLALRRLSRAVDRFRLADETMVSFTHDRELPWLLPGVQATDRTVEVLTVTVVAFRKGLITSQRTLWDHARLTEQLGVSMLVAACS
ncbi:MAG: hypothetical protein JOZ07_19720 [Solirubrobacterales bacterium]|nr:hypothetical protein [Solirubrobacterales bacterium]